MKPKQRTEWIINNRCKADDAMRLLRSAKKQRVSEYDERLRKLKDFADILFVKQTDDQQELFNEVELLSEELKALIAAPLSGIEG